jgi:hypothetical protein
MGAIKRRARDGCLALAQVIKPVWPASPHYRTSAPLSQPRILVRPDGAQANFVQRSSNPVLLWAPSPCGKSSSDVALEHRLRRRDSVFVAPNNADPIEHSQTRQCLLDRRAKFAEHDRNAMSVAALEKTLKRVDA